MLDTGLPFMKHKPSYYVHLFAGWYYVYRRIQYRDKNGRLRTITRSMQDVNGNPLASCYAHDLNPIVTRLRQEARDHFSGGKQ